MWPLEYFVVSGHSMEPQFREGERIVINRLSYLFSNPKPNDIVAVEDPEQRGKILLKKVIKIEATGKFFVEGINKLDSLDSRFFGATSKDLIRGKFWFRY